MPEVGDWLNSIKGMVANWITDVLGMVAQNIWKWLVDHYHQFDSWLGNLSDSIILHIVKALVPIDAIKTTGKAITDFILSPITKVSDAWQQFIKSLGPEYQSGGASGASRGAGGGWGGVSQPSVYNPLIRAPLAGRHYNAGVWDSILEGIARQEGVDPILLKSIARQEGVLATDYNPFGISPHGGPPTHYGSVAAGAAGMDAYVRAHLAHFKAVIPGDRASIERFANWYSPPNAPNDPYRVEAGDGGSRYRG
jgi:hypothetical protein